MKKYPRHFDTASLATIFMTLVLFVVALFEKGFTHDILLEAGVFLVSVKLILMSYKQSATSDAIKDSLSEIKERLKR